MSMVKPLPFHRPLWRRVLVALLAGTLLGAADFAVHVSSTTVNHKRLTRHRRRRAKVFTANPAFQGPSPRAMPTHAPSAPQLIAPPPAPKPTAAQQFLRTAARVMTTTWNNNIFVWLPAISTDPNSGPTYGLLPVWVLSENVHHHIRHLVAPSYTHNETFGETVTGRYYFYPTDQSQLYATASYSSHTNRTVKIRYEDTAFLEGRAFLHLEGFQDIDGSQRFFGVGPETQSEAESGYTGYNKIIHVDLGENFLGSWRATLGLRFRRMAVAQNIVKGVNDLQTASPGIPGLAEKNTVVQEFRLLWDSRDLPVTPSSGTTGELFFEKTSQGWGSDADFIRYGIDGTRYIPWCGGTQVTVIHGLYDWANGPNIPFYELATLGGRDTLRGYGEGRFSDQGRILFNAEQRFLLTSLSLMGVEARFEVGPLFDIGTVFPRAEAIRRKDFRAVYGGSFRAVVKPNVVGSVDVGVGQEGAGVFVGINYPF